ncbi:MAG TPA: type II secretion system protein GspM [Solirubrobacteraceae bacterium]|nr:type II secretion system protein GspM [Solirubrobacteraceae bacterium]
MTGRDRLVIMGIVVLAVLAGAWIAVVSPERKQAASLEGQVASAQQALAGAESQAADARSAQARYVEAYKSIVSLGKAVPPQDEVPSLIYELDQASNQRSIEFNSISSGNSAGAGGGGAAAAAPASAASVFTSMPFTFVFKGSFFGLAHLLSQIDGFADATPAPGSAGSTATASDISGVDVSGRLLTIQSVDLTVEGAASSPARLHAPVGGTGTSGSQSELKATITATAYVLPASQGLTAGATPTGPAGATASPSATASSSPAAPAVIRVTP